MITRLRATGPLRELMAAYFRELDEAAHSGSAPLAWCTSVGPAELLRAFGFLVYFPENHGAMLGSSRMATELIPLANAVGYSPEVCSYLTSDVGSWLAGRTPLTRAYGLAAPPRPQVLVYNTNQCRDVQDWFSFYQRELGVPLVGIETPRSVGAIRAAHLAGLTAQYRELIPTLEQIAGRRFDLDRLREVVASSHRCTLLWKRVLRAAENRPSPLAFFDAITHMGPAVVMRGDPRAECYYELLVDELQERIGQGVGAVAEERHRFYWEGMPVWGRLREHAELFAGRRACVVASTYCNSWIFEALGDSDPFLGMARAYLELFITRAEWFKADYLRAMARDYQIDGFIYHDAKTCPNNSNDRYGLPRRLAAELGLPQTVIYGDLNDLRLCSDEQTRTQIEALVEQLEQARA
jgi:benzoyl-CoA reductase/2-hydroxyglutaryl-CoA dehydratase subunit BcrC/BadD/HgdB